MDYFLPNDDIVRSKMLKLISQHHPHLASIDKRIAIIFRETAAKSGGVPVKGKTKRVNALMNAMMKMSAVKALRGPLDKDPDEEAELSLDEVEDFEFLIELAHDEWQALSDKQEWALLDHCLCAMSVMENDETGDLKFSLVAPDFSGYEEEYRRHGIWDKPSHGIVPAAITELFE
jgi:hypothetical protein